MEENKSRGLGWDGMGWGGEGRSDSGVATGGGNADGILRGNANSARVSNTPGTLSKSDNFRGEGNAERGEPGTRSS